MQFITEYDSLLLTLLVYILAKLVRKRTRGPSPPGPQGLPFIGNAYQIPADRQWLKFDEWIREYGMSS